MTPKEGPIYGEVPIEMDAATPEPPPRKRGPSFSDIVFNQNNANTPEDDEELSELLRSLESASL